MCDIVLTKGRVEPHIKKNVATRLNTQIHLEQQCVSQNYQCTLCREAQEKALH